MQLAFGNLYYTVFKKKKLELGQKCCRKFFSKIIDFHDQRIFVSSFHFRAIPANRFVKIRKEPFRLSSNWKQIWTHLLYISYITNYVTGVYNIRNFSTGFLWNPRETERFVGFGIRQQTLYSVQYVYNIAPNTVRKKQEKQFKVVKTAMSTN